MWTLPRHGFLANHNPPAHAPTGGHSQGDTMNTEEKQYIVCWHFKSTPEKVRHGQPISLEDATAWVKEMNEKYPELHHWVEEAK